MITGIAVLDRSGDILAVRRYRRDFDDTALENYRIGVISAKEIKSPVTLVDGTSFLHYLENEIYYVAATRSNANVGLIFELLNRIPKLLKSVCGFEANISEIRTHVPDLLEILDEIVDTGYPQNTDPDTVRALTQRPVASKAASVVENQVTIAATGATSWRMSNIAYNTNEIYVDVVEKVSMLCSASGKVLDATVNGAIEMKCYLSGMPECKIGFNDKLSGGSAMGGVARSGASIEVDDMVFHQCVKLTSFANDRAIAFIPPDGEFQLMRYRKTENVSLPFTISPMVKDVSQTKIEIRVSVTSNYDMKLSATPLIVKIPMPANCASTQIDQSQGKGIFVGEQNAVVWKISGFAGRSQADITILVTCLASTSNESPAMKISDPISCEFNIPMLSASGLALQYLKVVEKSNYTPEKWIRYLTQAGKYEVRMV